MVVVVAGEGGGVMMVAQCVIRAISVLVSVLQWWWLWLGRWGVMAVVVHRQRASVYWSVINYIGGRNDNL